MSYFECNLPDSCPHICAGKRSYFEDTVKVIKARMAKLDDALAKSGMDGAAFAKTAKILFDNSFDLFERMDSVELAMWVQNSYDGKPIEHRFEWPNAEVVVDCAFVQTKEWEALRHFGIGVARAGTKRRRRPTTTRWAPLNSFRLMMPRPSSSVDTSWKIESLTPF